MLGEKIPGIRITVIWEPSPDRAQHLRRGQAETQPPEPIVEDNPLASGLDDAAPPIILKEIHLKKRGRNDEARSPLCKSRH